MGNRAQLNSTVDQLQHQIQLMQAIFDSISDGVIVADENGGLTFNPSAERIIGSTLRARSIAAKSAVMDGLQRDVWPKIEKGSIEPIVETVFPMPEAQRAHDLVASNETVGKVMLEL